MPSEGTFSKGRTLAVTLEDVARAAGVSPATVSRYLNNPAMVSPALQARVRHAIEHLEYVPHAAARSLASRRSRMIGAVFPSLETTLFGGPLESLQTEIAAEGYSLVVASSNYQPEREREHIHNLVASGVDALMLIGGARPSAFYRPIMKRKLPYVLIWVSQAEGGHPSIGFDNAAAAEEITRHLLDIGHRRIGVISGILANNDRAQARLNGVRTAMAARGLALAEESMVEQPFGIDEGRTAFRLLMSRQPRPTAIVCGSDPFAYGAIFESQALGLRIPQDVSVTGFDDMSLSGQLSPALTSVRTPRRQMGKAAGQYLLSLLAGKETLLPRRLGFDLIVRDSTAPPAAEGRARPVKPQPLAANHG